MPSTKENRQMKRWTEKRLTFLHYIQSHPVLLSMFFFSHVDHLFMDVYGCCIYCVPYMTMSFFLALLLLSSLACIFCSYAGCWNEGPSLDSPSARLAQPRRRYGSCGVRAAPRSPTRWRFGRNGWHPSISECEIRGFGKVGSHNSVERVPVNRFQLAPKDRILEPIC